MKKYLAIILSLILLLSMAACNDKTHKDLEDEDIVNDAISVLKSKWEDIYSEPPDNADGYFEIKNTRVIEIKKNDIEEFKDVDYIIDFVLYTDYFASAPYYLSVGAYDSVVVYNNGDMEVSQKNLLMLYAAKRFDYDFSDIIETVNDYGDQYNCVEKLK